MRAPHGVSLEQQHCFARVDGCRLHWVDCEGIEPGGPPLVLLHGLSDSYSSWMHLVPRLARDRRVLVPDLPGHGLSARPDASYELKWYAHVMACWLESRGLESVDVVGHSFGGGVAMMMLPECRRRIRRLILVSSGGLGREISFLLRLASIPYLVERFGQPFMGPATRLGLMATAGPFSQTDGPNRSAMNARGGSARAFARTVRDIIDWRGQRRSFLERPPDLALPPIAVFWGDRDAVIPISHARALAQSMDGVRLTVFDGCGHYPHHQQPEAFVRAVGSFLRDPSVRAARTASTGATRAPLAPAMQPA
jgi:pimeloyl-ACP methyl ester carboxylesterase